MKILVSKKSFLEALSTANRFTTSKAQLPILGNILLESKNNKLNISATNLEMSVMLSIASKIEKEGKITIPSKVIYEVISNLNTENIDLNVDKETLIVKSGSFSSNILGMNASDFLHIPSSLSNKSLAIDSDVVSTILPKVIYSVSSDETRPTLTGVLMLFEEGKMSLVATDGFRLSRNIIGIKSIKEPLKIILPRGILSELGRLSGNEKILFEYKKDDKQVVFQIGQIFLSSRVIEGEFPDYDKIIPNSSKLKVGIDKEDLLQGIKLAGVFARTASNVVKFVIKEKAFKLIAESSISGSQENTIDAKIEYNGKDVFDDKGEFVIAFNCEFVEDYLNSIDGQNIEIGFNDVNSPGVFLDTEDKNLLHLIMPVRLQE